MKILNRPMFRMGGPIKEGIMNGIKEPRQGYKVGSKVSLSDQAKAFENIFTTPQTTEQQATQFATGYPRNIVRNIPPVVEMSLKERIENAPDKGYLLDDVGMPTGDGKGYIGNEPGIDKTTKEFFKGIGTRGQSEGYRDALKEVEIYKNPPDRTVVTGGKSPFNYTVDEVIKEKDTVIDTEGNRKKSINNILEKLGYARSQKNALYDALIKGGQRIAREGLGKEGLVADLIQDTSTSYDKPEKIREAAELMQVQQDLKLEGIDRSKDNRGTIQKNADYYQSKDGGGYSKEVSIRMARNLPTTMSEYFAASKATSNQAKLYDATRAATKDGKLFGNVDYMGKINKKKYENISDFLITSPDDGVYNILGRVIVIKDGEKVTEVVVQPEVDSKGWFKRSE